MLVMRILFIAFIFSCITLAEKTIVVDLSKQKAYAREDNRTIFKGNISSGKPGHETPNGIFRVSQKKVEHKSTLYPKPNGGGPMDFMMRLNGSSYALHLGDTPGYPASSGCIRLEYGFAQKVYRWASVGIKVIIRGDADRFKGRSAEENTHNIIIDEEIYPGNIALNRLNVKNDEMY